MQDFITNENQNDINSAKWIKHNNINQPISKFKLITNNKLTIYSQTNSIINRSFGTKIIIYRIRIRWKQSNY